MIKRILFTFTIYSKFIIVIKYYNWGNYRMKKVTTLLLSLLLVGGLTACGSSESNSNVTSTAQKEKTTTSSEESADTTEKKPEAAAVGTRSNPIKFNEVATVETVTYDTNYNELPTTIELSVSSIIRGEEAYKKLLEMNQFNEAAPEGYEWVLALTKVKVTASETQDYPFTITWTDFSILSQSGDQYSGDTYASTEPMFDFEMYEGNEKEGYIAGLVKIGEAPQMKFGPLLDEPVFFNLQ
jgi:hypothetical protein